MAFVFCSLIMFGQKEVSLDSLCSGYVDQMIFTEFCEKYQKTLLESDIDSQIEVANMADSLGQLNLKNAEYTRAIAFLSYALDIWVKTDAIQKKGFDLLYIGRAHYRLGNSFESFQYLNEALLIAQEIKDYPLEGLGHLYLSWNYWRIRQCDEAKSQLKGLKILIDANLVSSDQLAAYYNARAKFEYCLDHMEECFVMADSAIYLAQKENQLRLVSVAISNKVNYLRKYGTFEEKLTLMNKAIQINKELNDKEQLGSNLGLLGNVYWKEGMYKECLEVGLQSLEIAKEIQDKPRIHVAHNVCRQAYEGLKDYSNAYIHERGSRLVADEIYSLGGIDKIFDLQKDKAKAEHNQKLNQIANEKKLEDLKIAQERRMYAIGFGAMTLLLLGGIWNWVSYKKNKEKETKLMKEVLENEMKKLELQSLRALMNPHFIFNSLNSIKGYIVRNEPRVAANYLNKFSHLIRLILANSQKTLITLKEELNALDIYIQLEGMRLQDNFTYQIKVGEDINQDGIKVAPMIIQPYVENAIWHGLMNLSEEKKLDISIQQKNEILEISIRDNGIGRIEAKKRKQKIGNKKQSFGMKITEDRIKFTQKKNTVFVNDLVDTKGNSLGTEVIIQLKVNYNEKAAESLNY